MARRATRGDETSATTPGSGQTAWPSNSNRPQVQLLKDLGFDAAWNYKATPPAAGLASAAPKGLDVYVDNVGAETLEAALDAANVGARIVACGMVSQYDLAPEERYGVKNLFNVVGKQ